MVNCRKCSQVIKPAMIAVTIKERNYHPACVSCARCDRGLWGKDYNRQTDGTLLCVRPCTPHGRPASVRTSSAAPVTDSLTGAEIRVNKAGINKGGVNGASRYKPVLAADTFDADPSPPPSTSRLPPSRKLTATLAKFCAKCRQSVLHKKYITFEDGEVNCQDCSALENLATPRPKSAHIILCSICNRTVTGTRYFTEPDNTHVCQQCDARGARCFQCKGLFKYGQAPCIVQNPSIPGTGIQLHKDCFNCHQCQMPLEPNNYFQLSDASLLPVCQLCYEASQPAANSARPPSSGSSSADPAALCIKCASAIAGPCLIVEGQPIHHDCFRCSGCQASLTTETGFYKSAAGDAICATCDQAQSSYLKCAKCLGPISGTAGVQHNFKSYHPECYSCAGCGVNLSLMRKAVSDKDNKGLFCEGCFIKDLAPRCHKCREPIYMPHRPGTKCEGRDYHLSCFACAKCKKTLADKKFFKQGNNIFKCEICF